MRNYLSLADQGKNNWWRYLIGLLLIGVFWQLIGAIPLTILFVMVLEDGNPATDVDSVTLQFEGINYLWPYLAINFTLLSMLIGVFLTTTLLHKRPFLTLITALESISWHRLFLGFSVYFVLIATVTSLEALWRPENFQFSLDMQKFLLFLPLAILITPLQAAAEELLFRGYIMQWFGRLGWHFIFPVIASSTLFMLAHLTNPEVTKGNYLIPLLYLFLGLFLAIITVKSNSLELAIGVHTANNLFTVLIMNYTNSALTSPSIFTTTEIDPVTSLISLTVIASLFYWIVFKRFGIASPRSKQGKAKSI